MGIYKLLMWLSGENKKQKNHHDLLSPDGLKFCVNCDYNILHITRQPYPHNDVYIHHCSYGVNPTSMFEPVTGMKRDVTSYIKCFNARDDRYPGNGCGSDAKHFTQKGE
jgi:hypothetical protein